MPKKPRAPRKLRCQFNLRWSAEEDVAARTMARALGLTMQDFLRVSIALHVKQLRANPVSPAAAEITACALLASLALHRQEEIQRMVKKENA